MPTPAQDSATPEVPMIGPKGEPVTIAQDRVEAATLAGYKPAIKMTGPDGSPNYVAQDRVPAAREAKYQVTPDNPGVQRMATPQGQITYALPSEVDQFKASGHVPIDDSGNFRVDPIAGESNVDTMARARKITENLPPDVLKQAIAAEEKTFTAKRLATTLAAAPVIGALGAAGIAGLGEAGAATGAVLGPARAFLGQVGKEIAQKYAGQTAAKITADILTSKGTAVLGGGGLGAYLIHKLAGGK